MTMNSKTLQIDPNNSQLLIFTSSSHNLAAGIAVGEIVFGVSDAGSYLGCVGKDIRLEAVVCTDMLLCNNVCIN
jgi:hypothetical protein